MKPKLPELDVHMYSDEALNDILLTGSEKDLKRPTVLYEIAVGSKARLTKNLEDIVRKSPVAVYYAKFVIGGPWKEAELYIAQDATAACYYATKVLNKRWLKAEREIKKRTAAWSEYSRHFNI